jgi:hypothetical protein
MRRRIALCANAVILLLAGPATAEEPVSARADPVTSPVASPVTYAVTEEREPCTRHEPTRRPFFGDTHVHTAYSFDASTQDTRNKPRDAYRFARGERIGIQPYDENGEATRSIQLDRPLDFVAVTDHAALLGDVNVCMTPGSGGYDSWICWLHRNKPKWAMPIISARSLIMRSHWGSVCGDDWSDCIARTGKVWKQIAEAAEAAYDRSSRCEFTSFVAYEWTATMDDGKNLHRNVIFRNERIPEMPISWVDTPSATKLWQHLQRDCIDGVPGCDVLTIPHNSNISSNLMFATARIESSGDVDLPVDAREARLRNRWEPLVEIMQHKGDSECLLGGSTTDEACGFEKLAYDRFGPKFSFMARNEPPTAQNFVRNALMRGLAQQASIGANSLKYGIIASTDTHIAAPGLTAEKDHPGHGGAGLAAGKGVPVGFPDDLEFGPGGLAVLWAEENTRDALFAAMQRREAYGTSGPRPVVRLFGGWGYEADLCDSDDLAARGYAGGVPMGGDLRSRPEGASAPRFAFSALGDPGTADAPGAPLQRLQIVKGWVEDGATHERVYDVAGGENGAGVDLLTCERTGAGASSLCVVWSDPDFDPSVPSFYYGRLLENPSCRWSQYVCNQAGVRCGDPDSIPDALEACCSEAHRPIIQERAWTSPIWYTPSAL